MEQQCQNQTLAGGVAGSSTLPLLTSEFPQERVQYSSLEPHVAPEHPKCSWPKGRCVVGINDTPDFTDQAQNEKVALILISTSSYCVHTEMIVFCVHWVKLNVPLKLSSLFCFVSLWLLEMLQVQM